MSTRTGTRTGTRRGDVALATAFVLTVAGAVPGVLAIFVSMSWHGRSSLLIVLFWFFTLLPLALQRYPQALRDALVRTLPLTLFGVLAIASTLWSAAPHATLSTSLLMMGVIFNGIVAGVVFGWRALMTGLAIATLILSFIAPALIPFGGLMDADMNHALRGPWPEKNEAGSVFALGVIACVMVAKFDKQPAWLLAAAWQIFIILLTKSATSLAAAVIGVAGLVAIHLAGAGPRRLIAGIWALVSAGGAAVFLLIHRPDILLGLLGRDATLTGRSFIWEALIRRAQERPWFGWGYASWWSPENPHRPWLYKELDFEVFSAHNSVLEIVLGIGLAGLALMIIALAMLLLAGLMRLHRPGDPQRDTLAMFAALLILGASESALTGPEGLTLTLFSVLLGRVKLRFNPAATG